MMNPLSVTTFMMLWIISSSGMAMMDEDEDAKKTNSAHQDKSAIFRSFQNEGVKDETDNSRESKKPQIKESSLSSFVPETEEADTVSIPFFQPPLSSEHWGISQEEVDYLFENSSDYIAIAKEGSSPGQGRFQKVNKKFQEATGWSEKELIEQPFIFFWHPDEIPKFMKYVEFAKNRLATWGFEVRKRCKDGSYIWIQWLTLTKLTTPLLAFEEREFFCVGRDITQQKEQEEARLKALEESQQEIKSLNRSLQDQNKILRAISEIQFAYIEREDLSHQQGCREEDNFPVHYKIFDFILQHFIELSESEYGFIGELFYDVNHQPFVQQVFAGKAKDLFINEKLQQILSMYQGKGRRLCNFNNVLGDIVATKKPLIINDVKSYPKPTGIPAGHIPINSFLGVPFIFNNELVGVVALANRSEGYGSNIVQWLEPLSLLTGRIINELKMEHWRKEAERESLARKHADASNAAKSVFLAHMSHEIRTPLTGILGLIDLINQDSLVEEDRTYLQTAQMSGWSLMTLLNDILDVSKIEAGQIKLEKIEFDPINVVQEVIQLLSLEAKKQRTSLTTTINPEVPHRLIGDPLRLRQIFFNLIGNAIKFTKQGSISVSLGSQEGTETKNIFCLKGTVTDTGIGIKPETQHHLFQPFSQADESMMRQFGGTGLGLFISKKLCEVMNGDIKVSSRFGAGSTFQFTVKMEIPEEQDSSVLIC